MIEVNVIPRRYWPYDEVMVTRDVSQPARFVIEAPWTQFHIDINPAHVPRAEAFIAKLSSGQLAYEDLDEVNWFFAPLAKFPLAYLLPRAEDFGTDDHEILSPLATDTPFKMLRGLTDQITAIEMNWSWDTQTAIEFSHAPDGGYDPETLFSVARRFHLLDTLEKRAELEADYGSEPYVTALSIAQSARGDIGDFAERATSAQSRGILAEVFSAAAKRNLLGFAMISEMVESARGREATSIRFIRYMSSVEENYAREALKLAELATLLTTRV